MKPTYRITEYGSFVAEKNVDGAKHIPQKTFDELKKFILLNRDNSDDGLELMGISYKKCVGEVITAKNYVGMISMKDGTTVEILPKICSKINDEDGSEAKKLIVKMLKTLRKSPFKNIQTSTVNIAKMDIFEIFIRMFVEEIFTIVKHGLKCTYDTVEENSNRLKGKMLFSKQIKFNFAHKERSYVEYDEFNTNRPENSLIKSTLSLLYRQTKSSKNKTDIKTLLNAFSEVPESVNYDADFSKCISDRNTKDYSRAMIWCRIFLKGKSFTSFAGSDVAYALLFPMETLFESYIACLIKKEINPDVYIVSAQDKSHHLFEKPEIFSLRPDIVITRKSDNTVFVMDTKWKLLNDVPPTFGISQSDMYQMYAYQKKYDAQNITLIYPSTDAVPDNQKISFDSGDGVTVNVKFVDLFDAKNSIKKILQF